MIKKVTAFCFIKYLISNGFILNEQFHRQSFLAVDAGSLAGLA